MADNHEVIIKVNADTGSAQNSVQTLKKEFKEANDNASSLANQLRKAKEDADRLTKEFGETSSAVKAATSRVHELEGSFNAAANKVAGLKNEMDEFKLSVKNFNPDNKLQALVGIGQGAVGAVQGVAGAMALVGVESDNAAKVIARLQGLMAMSDALNSIGDIKDSMKNFGSVLQGNTILAKANAVANNVTAGAMRMLGVSANATSMSFKALKIAIAATGIGLIVVAIGTLLPMISNWISKTDEAEAANKRLEDSVRSLNEELAFNTKWIEHETQLRVEELKQAGASQEEIFKKEIEGRKKVLEELKKNLDEKTRIHNKAANEHSKKTKELGDEQIAALQAVKDAERAIEIAEAKEKTRIAEEQRQRKKQQDDKEDTEAQQRAGRQKAEREKRQAEIDAELKEIATLQAEANKNIRQSGMTARQVELDNLLSDFKTKEALYRKHGKDITEITKEYYIAKQAIESKYSQSISEYLKSINQNEYEQRREEIQKNYENLIKDAEGFSQQAAMIAARDQELKKVDDEEAQVKLVTEKEENLTRKETTLITAESDNAPSDDDTPDVAKEKLQNLYNARVEVETAEYERQKVAAANNKAELEKIEAQHNANKKSMAEDLAADQKAIDEAVKEAKLDNMQAVGSALGALSNLIGQETVAGKALAIGQATIDTYVGANKALAQGGLAGIAGAVAVIATGILNVKKIVSTKVGKKDNLGGASIPGPHSPMMLAPQLNLQAAQQQQVQNVRVTNQQDTVTRTYLVDRDLQNQQQKNNFLNNVLGSY